MTTEKRLKRAKEKAKLNRIYRNDPFDKRLIGTSKKKTKGKNNEVTLAEFMEMMKKSEG